MLNGDGSLGTIAGTGTFGFGGDGAPATAAQLAFPTGLTAIGTPCVVYVADSSNNRVRRFTPGGPIETVAGNGQRNADKRVPAAGQDPSAFPISQPNDAAVDPAGGVLFVSSNFDRVVYRVPLGTR
jgi:hypothetical protein